MSVVIWTVIGVVIPVWSEFRLNIQRIDVIQGGIDLAGINGKYGALVRVQYQLRMQPR